MILMPKGDGTYANNGEVLHTLAVLASNVHRALCLVRAGIALDTDNEAVIALQTCKSECNFGRGIGVQVCESSQCLGGSHGSSIAVSHCPDRGASVGTVSGRVCADLVRSGVG